MPAALTHELVVQIGNVSPMSGCLVRVGPVIGGRLFSNATIAGVAVYAAAGFPQIALSATRVAYTRRGWKTAVRVFADDARVGRLLARYPVEEKKVKRFVAIDDGMR